MNRNNSSVQFNEHIAKDRYMYAANVQALMGQVSDGVLHRQHAERNLREMYDHYARRLLIESSRSR